MSDKKKKIAYVTGTRADFGLMRPVLDAINNNPGLELQLFATGMHLLPQHGNTIEEVRSVFSYVVVINQTIQGDQPKDQAYFFSSLSVALADVFSKQRPDVVLVLGDRPEMLAVASACLYLQIPVAHIHGGERTGTADEIARHAITKLASFHFAATNDAVKRLEKLGEASDRIVLSGAPGIDALLSAPLLDKAALFSQLQLPQLDDFILLTLHPDSQAKIKPVDQIKIVLESTQAAKLPIILIYPNADPGGQAMINYIEKISDDTIYSFKSVNHDQFLALAREARLWVGNSSAGLIESPTLKVPVVNIGDRQLNRLRADNVIDATFDSAVIFQAIQKALSPEFQSHCQSIKNPWGDGLASQRIIETLIAKDFSQFIFKQIIY